jgi:hypothetical protein
MIEYKTWEGNYPHVILLSPKRAVGVLYYETGFEQLHPFPNIIDWMEKRNYNYNTDWRVVKVDPEWALCFAEKQVCELFALRWL